MAKLNIVQSNNNSKVVTISGDLSIGDNGSAVFINNSGFIATGQTGIFATAANLAASGANLQTQLNIVNSNSGNLTGQFYPRFANPSGYLTGIVAGTSVTVQNNNNGTFTINSTASGGSGSSVLITGQSVSNPNFTGAGNVSVTTGSNGTVYISGNTGVYANFTQNSVTGNFATANNLNTTGATLQGITNIISGNLNSTGSNLLNQINTINSLTGSFTSLYVTGRNLNVANLTGAGNVVVTTGSNGLVFISGNTGAYANFITPSQTGSYATAVNLAATGSTLIQVTNIISGNLNSTGSSLLTQINSINTITGGFANQFYPRLTNPSNFVSGQSGIIIGNGTGAILNGQLLIGTASGNAFEQGNLYALTGLITVSGSGSLGVGVDVTKTVTGLVAGSNVNISTNGSGLYTINSTASGAGGAGNITGINGLTGAITLTGRGGVTVYTGASGIINISGSVSGSSGFLYVDGFSGIIPNGQILIGSSGDNAFIQGDIKGLSGIIVQSGSGLINIVLDNSYFSGLVGGVSSVNARSGALNLVASGDIQVTTNGQTITIGYTGISVGSTIQITGATVSNPNFTGVGNVIVSTGGGGTVFVSGNTGAYANFATTTNLAATGSSLQTQINSLGAPGGLSWSLVTGSSFVSANNGYIVNCLTGVCNLLMPATGSIGNIVRITSLSASGWRVNQSGTGFIYFGNASTTTGISGYMQSTHARDTIEMVCTSTSGWNIISSIGNIYIN